MRSSASPRPQPTSSTRAPGGRSSSSTTSSSCAGESGLSSSRPPWAIAETVARSIGRRTLPLTVGGVPRPPLASLGDSFSSFFDAVGDFVSNLAGVQWGSLLLGVLAFAGYLSLRARAAFHILRAAYPVERFRFRAIWGAYMAGYGFNSVVPARGGDVIRLFLTKTSIP